MTCTAEVCTGATSRSTAILIYSKRIEVIRLRDVLEALRCSSSLRYSRNERFCAFLK